MYLLVVLLLVLSQRTIVASEISKVYALYFPQFHQDPVNDLIWGEGFTDWDNLKKTPLVNRQNQTILRPLETVDHTSQELFGYYDLLQQTTRDLQSRIAKQYGVDGFIYHHYWFYHNESALWHNAVLSRPLLKLLEDGEPHLPFAFNWAFESWTRTWHGTTVSKVTSDILYEQVCPEEGSPLVVEHYQFLRKFFHHPLYIKVNGLPVFFIYHHYPCSDHVLPNLQHLAMQDGFPSPGLYLLGGSVPMPEHELYTKKGMPDSTKLFPSVYSAYSYYPYYLRAEQAMIPSYCFESNHRKKLTKPQYVSTQTLFDNTPRRTLETAVISDRLGFKVPQLGNSSISKPLTPVESFEMDLVTIMVYEQCCQDEEVREQGGKFVFVASWNEWAEGMVLEPSQVYGFAFLEAIRSAKEWVRKINCNWNSYHEILYEHFLHQNVSFDEQKPF